MKRTKKINTINVNINLFIDELNEDVENLKSGRIDFKYGKLKVKGPSDHFKIGYRNFWSWQISGEDIVDSTKFITICHLEDDKFMESLELMATIKSKGIDSVKGYNLKKVYEVIKKSLVFLKYQLNIFLFFFLLKLTF